MTDQSGIDSSGRERYPLRAQDVAAVVSFWALLALVSAVSREIDPRIPGIPGSVWSATVTATYVEYTLWAVITLPIWWLASRYTIELGRRWGRLLGFLALGVAIAIVMDGLLQEVRGQLMEPLGRIRRRPPPPLVGLGILDDLIVYLGVLAAGVARDYILRYRARLEDTVRLQALLAQARLETLRSQLNPHFLFNTLNAVSALVERDPKGTRRMIARLSDLLRYTLEESTAHEVPLHQELQMLSEYVDLMQIRFQGKLVVTFDIEAGVRSGLVPSLILQPIVENAVVHGVTQLSVPGRILVRARHQADDLVVTVTDNGPGPGTGQGIGLSNASARLSAMYGPGASVTLRPASEAGTVAELTLPYHEVAIPLPPGVA
ncbi:MAG: histidine kinase [Gemmatimonadaceae bacterium]